MKVRDARIATALAWLALNGCSGRPGKEPAAAPFQEVAAASGLVFHHFTGATGEFFMPEIVGSGVALFDYDGDGDLDIYFVQSAFLNPSKNMAQALYPPPAEWKSGNRLFRNELVPEGRLRFTDVTAQAGVGAAAFGQGAIVGDYDNDGHPDLYVTNFGRNILYHNNGNGSFTDVTRAAGVEDDAASWSTSASFLDYDGDGLLDLFVAHYVDFPLKLNPACRNPAGERDYCGPKVFKPVPSRLYHNLGKGRFEDVTRAAGLTSAYGAGLGVQAADFNRDGKLDLYIANDQNPNNLWLNRGNGRFEDAALSSGCAYSADGRALSGMGVGAADVDNDGWEDVFVTNLMGETNSFFHNLGQGQFEEAGMRFHLAAPSLPYTGFGAGFFDYDNDGYLDLFAVNGAVETVPSLRGTPYPYHQLNRLYRNLLGARFEDVSDSSGPALGLRGVGRGVAFGDLDNDGRVDLVVTNNNGPARLLLNTTPRRHFLLIQLQGQASNRMGLGAEAAVLRSGSPMVWRRAHTDGSYVSSSDPRVHFGLGGNARIEGVVVRWPGGRAEVWSGIAADRVVKLVEGTGRPWSGR